MNRQITRLVLSFVLLSLAVTLVPLLEGGAGRPLIPGVHRGLGLTLYAGFLLVFVLVLFPESLRERPERSVGAWAVLLLLLGVFAAVPAVVCAYVSGVSREGLAVLGAWTAAAASFVLAAHRWLGRRAAAHLVRAAALLWLFVLPAWAWHRSSFGLAVPSWWSRISVWEQVGAVTLRHQTPSPVFVLALAAAFTMLALWPRRAGRVATFLPAVVLLVPLGSAIGTSPEVRCREPWAGDGQPVRSLAGGGGRTGLRTPLRVLLAPGEDRALVELPGERYRVEAPGADLLVTLPPAPARLVVEGPAGRRECGIPVDPAHPDQVLVGWVTAQPGPPPELPPPAVVAIIPSGDFFTDPWAYEAFDALLIAEREHASLDRAARAALEGFAFLGGSLVIVLPEGAVGPEGRVRRGRGSIERIGMQRSATLAVPPRPRVPGPVQPELLRTIVPPGWQEMDLSAVLVVLLAYHAAFLVAFLLPLLLDARKALVVYLSSVSFVTLAVAAGGYWSLKQVFLRDNQIYTQSLALVVSGPGRPAPAVLHQLLGFASMSGETADLALPAEGDLVLYRSGDGVAGPVREHGAGQLRWLGVGLDRHDRKAIVRHQGFLELDVQFVPVPGTEAFELDLRTPWVPSPSIEELWRVRAGEPIQRYERRAGRFELVESIPDGAPFAGDLQLYFRRLLGHFCPELRSYFVAHVGTWPRPDPTGGFLARRDLGAFLLVAVADP